MRTTVNIDQQLLEAARRLAVSTHRQVGDVIDDALRLLLAKNSAGTTDSVDLPTYGGSGLLPGVDLEDKDRLAQL